MRSSIQAAASPRGPVVRGLWRVRGGRVETGWKREKSATEETQPQLQQSKTGHTADTADHDTQHQGTAHKGRGRGRLEPDGS